MPGRDGTGPLGQGPMTGRGLGCCAMEVPANAGQPAVRGGAGYGWRGQGFGPGRGGRGQRNCYWSTGLPGWARFGGFNPAATPDAQSQVIQARIELLQAELDRIKAQLAAAKADPE